MNLTFNNKERLILAVYNPRGVLPYMGYIGPRDRVWFLEVLDP